MSTENNTVVIAPKFNKTKNGGYYTFKGIKNFRDNLVAGIFKVSLDLETKVKEIKGENDKIEERTYNNIKVKGSYDNQDLGTIRILLQENTFGLDTPSGKTNADVVYDFNDFDTYKDNCEILDILTPLLEKTAAELFPNYSGSVVYPRKLRFQQIKDFNTKTKLPEDARNFDLEVFKKSEGKASIFLNGVYVVPSKQVANNCNYGLKFSLNRNKEIDYPANTGSKKRSLNENYKSTETKRICV